MAPSIRPRRGVRLRPGNRAIRARRALLQRTSQRLSEWFIGREATHLGRRVIEALGFRTGFTHTEWFLTPSGEAMFGEIGGRPPGGRSVDLMNFTSHFDIYLGWAQAVGTDLQIGAA